MEKVRNAITGLMLLLMLSMTFVPAVSASEAISDSPSGTADSCECTDESIAQDSCGSCCGCTSDSCGTGDVTVTKLEGVEKNKAVAEALANEDVKQLRAMLIEKGHTPRVSNASAMDVGSDGIFVGIPFRPAESIDLASIGYVRTGDTTKVAAIEQHTIEGKTDILIYSIDEQGNIISQTIDIDWGCWLTCIGSQCGGCFYPGEPGICSGCCLVCAPCIGFPHPVTCGVCAVCVVLIVGYYCSDHWEEYC